MSDASQSGEGIGGGGPGRPRTVIELISYLADTVLGNWAKVLQVVLLICAPIVTVLAFVACVAIIFGYLGLDPQRWAAVGGSAGTVVISAAVWGWLRRIKGKRSVSGTDGGEGGA